MAALTKVLVVEDQPSTQAALAEGLRRSGHEVLAAGSAEEALGLLETVLPDLMLLDLGLPGMGGRELLEKLRSRFRPVPVVVVTARNDAEAAVACLKAGAADYLVKPVDALRLETTVAGALERSELSREVARLERATGRRMPPGLLGGSPAFQAMLSRVDEAAIGDRSVLVTGEPGSEVMAVALAIHALSHRAEGPFVPVCCGEAEGRSVEDALFGSQGQGGSFAAASRGTLYLASVESLPPSAQERLDSMMALSARARAGSTDAPDVRVVSSATAELETAVRRRQFRKGLYLRLAAVEVAVPPLRDREEDALLLLRHDLEARASALGLPPPPLTPAAREAALDHDWPGNREEVRQVAYRAVELAGAGPIDAEHLTLAEAGRAPRVASGDLADVEREALLAALERSGGNRSAAARQLGISRSTLYVKLRSYTGK